MVVMMVMLVLVVLVVMIMVMVVVLVILIIVVMIVMVVALALGIVALVLVMVVMMVMLVLQLMQLALEDVFLHDLADLRAVQLIPGGGDQAGFGVDALEQLDGSQGLGVVGGIGTAEDDQIGACHLVVEEFTEVAGVHLALARVHHGDFRADLRAFHALDGAGHVGQLADAGGLDEDAVRRIIAHDLAECLGEIAHEGAADAAGVHLGDLHAGVLQERAVDGDLAELVLDQNELFILVTLRDQLADQGRLTGSEKAGKNINSSQSYCLLCKLLSKCLLYHLLFCFTRLLPQSRSDSSGFVLTGRPCYAILSCNFMYRRSCLSDHG